MVAWQVLPISANLKFASCTVIASFLKKGAGEVKKTGPFSKEGQNSKIVNLFAMNLGKKLVVSSTNSFFWTFW